MIRPQNLAISVLLALLLLSLLGCADKPTELELTEEDIARIVAEELAKMADTDGHQGAINPQRIAVTLGPINPQSETFVGGGFAIGDELIATSHHQISDMIVGGIARLASSVRVHPVQGLFWSINPTI